jgi:hypothetical protein
MKKSRAESVAKCKIQKNLTTNDLLTKVLPSRVRRDANFSFTGTLGCLGFQWGTGRWIDSAQPESGFPVSGNGGTGSKVGHSIEERVGSASPREKTNVAFAPRTRRGKPRTHESSGKQEASGRCEARCRMRISSDCTGEQ